MTPRVPPRTADGAQPRGSSAPVLLGCVVLAHGDATHVHRLVRALDPLPVFLHCDASTSPEIFAAMTEDLPDRCTVLPRMSTGWAKWENVAAELAGYRAALADPAVTHVALLTGTDYPLFAGSGLHAVLAARPQTSLAYVHRLPFPGWGRSGGKSRFRYHHWAFRKHMIRVPVPRRLPDGVVLAGGSQLKVLTRAHARAVLAAADSHPELIRFWRRSWIADETFVHSILSTPRFVPDWDSGHVNMIPWWIGWDGTRRKSPPWLGIEHWPKLRTREPDEQSGIPRLFARKFSTAHSAAVLDLIDAELLSVPEVADHGDRR